MKVRRRNLALVAETDRARWDPRHAAAEPDVVAPPSAFAGHTELFPRSGRALDLACGTGAGSVWLASQGFEVVGVDVSPVAIERARALAESAGVASRCRFEVADLDHGLPSGPRVDVLFCHLFWNPVLVHPMIDRLLHNGLLAVATLSEVGAEPGRYRVPAGRLRRAFDSMDVLVDDESDGVATLIARVPARLGP